MGYIYLRADPGKAGGLIIDGDHGRTKYYKLELWNYSGAELNSSFKGVTNDTIQLTDTIFYHNGNAVWVTRYISYNGKMQNEPKSCN